ncbi:MAG: hypothetical protein GY928_30475 [Colwellia sp.]|nr:hypothetical protein [Colwellia sp.]
MITENEVVEAISKYLEKKGYVIDQALTTSQKGIDVEATHPTSGKYFVEAKGATSSRKESKRFGKPFNASQIKTHIGVALLKSFQTIQLYKNDTVAIALPNNAGHRTVIESMYDPIKKSGIKVLMVNADATVEEYI